MAPATVTLDRITFGRMVPIGDLFPSPLNPRKRFTAASLADLTANIQKRGEVIVPMILRTHTGKKGPQCEIVDGERRFRAATAAGVTQLPAIFRDDLTDGEVIEIQILSAIQRQELTPLEEAAGFKALIDSNKALYSATYIADRVGRSEKWVWDRMKLLDLIPILKQLLDADRILVGHAELLAKLKPEDQERAVEWTAGSRPGEGLWQRESGRLAIGDDDVADPAPRNLYAGLKPVTVKELEGWIARHVRFDVEHMAAAAPLEFAEVATVVAAAEAVPGRGKKVISITNDYRVDDDAKDHAERTYGQASWQRADGQEKSKTCEHSVLGVFVAGPGYGTTLQVCINRDKCPVHFGDVIKARKKNQKLRQQGKGGQAAQREQAGREQQEQTRRAEEAARKVWDSLKPKAVAAIDAHVATLPMKTLIPLLAKVDGLKVKTAEELIRALATKHASQSQWSADYLARCAKPYGFDLVAWIKAQRTTPVPTKAATTAPAPVKAKAAKKAKKR